ncbi:uncharacterized protein B0I36DRAFT_240309 [Microdochium trichocladiopsis]|uniref:Tat pathway signal sequence n=1 Tax=Microdochium trichocladiopsis TaxID=1682393 RepID=A0A9P9BTI8_9PEZI|nr:uncharacterized protein B0I36DRAFT_240309 [Microdochium trichocladiopsis]KAH7035654.1 hypothetical protein B0I36DRAFT_240309 [Microdochium trichocladiopsis]
MGKSQLYQPIDVQSDDGNKSSTEAEERYGLLYGEVRPLPRHSKLVRALLWLAAIIGIIVYTAVVAGTAAFTAYRFLQKNTLHGTRFLKSPANDYITYESRVMDQFEYDNEKQYFTDPSPEIDANWHELWRWSIDQNIAIQPELMEEMGRAEEGIRFPDGTYFGSMMVFHNLHCLKNIYHTLHPHYYGMNKYSESERAQHKEHTEHCLKMLKDAVMCQGDPTILTMKWAETGLRPIGNLTSPHECVNWDRLMEWVVPNSRNVFEDGMLVHPTRGSYNTPSLFCRLPRGDGG